MPTTLIVKYFAYFLCISMSSIILLSNSYKPDIESSLISSYVSHQADNVVFNSESSMLPSCDGCPGLSAAPLQGIIGYPQVDEMSLCSTPDTISLLIYNTGDCPMSNLMLTVNFDAGLAFGGFVQEQTGLPIAELNISDASNPQFLITQMDSAQVYILNFGVTADCDINASSTLPLNFDLTYEYTYVDDNTGKASCAGVETELGNYNNGVKIPVLNAISVSPQTRTLVSSGAYGCQNVTIRQDGLGAELAGFTFDVCGYDPAYSIVVFRTGAPAYLAIPYTTDLASGTLSGQLDSSHFAAVGDGDEVLDANEQVVVQICYEVQGCLDDPMFLEYKAYYGCNDKVCGAVTSIEAAVDFVPDYAANAIATSNTVAYGGICGDNVSFEIGLVSSNSDPIDGLWEDISLKMNACLGGNMSLVGVNMNGTPLPAGVVTEIGSAIEVDFSQLTTDPDGPGVGLEDMDGDGIYDDLPGGNMMDFEVEIAIGCTTGSMSCSPLACSISNVEVNGKRNCGQDFQQFAVLDNPVDFYYGESSSTNNNMTITGHSSPITEVFVTSPNVWLPFTNGYLFTYEFGSENIKPCSSGPGNLYAQVTVNANGNRINHLRYEQGSATYQGMPVPGVTWNYNTLVVDQMGTLDTTSITINIPAGDTANDPSHEYYFNLEAEGKCFPNDYMDVTIQIIEECADCGDPPPCKIIRSCNNANTYVDWNGLNCPCFIRGYVETQERTNYGYTDKSMTTKVDVSTIPEIDKKRYLPGDTMYVRQAFEILSAEVVKKGDGFWQFVLGTDGQLAAPVVPDYKHSMFKGWFIKKADTGAVTEIGVPTCYQDPMFDDVNRGNRTYPSMILYNFGAEGKCDNSVGFGTCLTNPRVNPNYPPEGIIDYALTPFSVNWKHADRPGFYLYWGQDPECASAIELAKNDCYEDFMLELDLHDGDIIYIDYEAPMMHNPDYDLQMLNGTSYSTQGNFSGYMTVNAHTADCKTARLATSCNSGSLYYGHLPGPIAVSSNVTVTDCDIQVHYDFVITNPVPATTAGEIPWWENEIRNAIAVEYLQPQFPNNLVS